MNQDSDVQRDIDREWAEVLELMQQFGNPAGVLDLVAEGVVPIPDWARAEIAAWRRGERPPLPSGDWSDADRNLLAADQALRNKAAWQPGERYRQALERITGEFRVVNDHGVVDAEVLNHFHNRRGGTFERILENWELWEEAYRKAGLL
jgi:hypothetical protein